MKTKNSFNTKELIVEIGDVIAIAKNIIKNLDDLSPGQQREINLAITNLDAAEHYLENLKSKNNL